MELYYGFHQAPMLTQRGPMVNVNIVHKAFISAKNVLELIKDILDLSYLPEYMNVEQTREVLEIIEGKKVEYTVNGLKRDYTINGFRGSAIKEIIPNEKKTVKDYFAEKKNYTIRNVKFQLMWVGDKKREPPILIPAELCTIKPGQVPRRSVNDNPQVVSNIIKVAATSTNVRKNKIMEQIRFADYANSPFLKEFGFSVGDEFEKVEARILDPPKLKYLNDNSKPDKGVWNIRGKKFLRSSNIEKWVVINLDSYVTIQRIKNLERVIIEQAKFLGIEMLPPDAAINLNSRERQFESKLQAVLETKKDGYLIIVIFSDKTTSYEKIKQLAELNVGCLTQCILSKTVNRETVPPSVISNILLKVNAKLDGVNHQLAEKPSFLKGNIMVMGADVTHPKSGSEDKASFAAVTASHDHDFFKYNIICQLQPPTKEVIANLESIVNQQLRIFHKKTRTKPDHIIFLRDGVSEGQFDDVKKFEIAAIRAACNNIQKDGQYKPLITFLTVLKRHHTRLFPTNPADSHDRNGNVPAGTCVDTGITHPASLNLQHFFLASHAAIQGVTKPAKYCTLHDDANLSYDDVEELCYYLCHMYCRCTRAVSYPAPTYYAHLAAERAKNLYKYKDINWDVLNQAGRIIVETKMEKNPMYFV